jgi:hypothetical protein
MASDPKYRLEEVITSPYDTDAKTWNALLTGIGSHVEDIERVEDDIITATFVDDASGAQLDKLASFFDISRFAGEGDASFRMRMKVELQAQIASGTIPDIREVAAALLDVNSEGLRIEEPDDDRPSVRVAAPVDEFGMIVIPSDVLNDTLQQVSAAGVDLDTQVNVGGYEVRIVYSSVDSSDLGAGDSFYGADFFDGLGAFGAGDSNDVLGTTLRSVSTPVVYTDASNSTVFEGFGASAFGAGSLDGDPDDTDVFSITSVDVFAVMAFYGEAASSEIKAGDFAGADAFDGAGAFGAGEVDSPFAVTTATYSVNTDYEDAIDTTVDEGFGDSAFGAGALDGNVDDGGVLNQTSVVSPIGVPYSPVSKASIIDGFGTDLFDGKGAFGAGDTDSPTTTTTASITFTAVWIEAQNMTIESDGFGAGTLDGSGTFS